MKYLQTHYENIVRAVITHGRITIANRPTMRTGAEVPDLPRDGMVRIEAIDFQDNSAPVDGNGNITDASYLTVRFSRADGQQYDATWDGNLTSLIAHDGFFEGQVFTL